MGFKEIITTIIVTTVVVMVAMFAIIYIVKFVNKSENATSDEMATVLSESARDTSNQIATQYNAISESIYDRTSSIMS